MSLAISARSLQTVSASARGAEGEFVGTETKRLHSRFTKTAQIGDFNTDRPVQGAGVRRL